MGNLPVKYFSLLAAFSLFILCGYSQSNGENRTNEKAVHWMKTGSWKNGLHVKAHSSVNPEEFSYQYHRNKLLWDEAFAFLNRKDLDTLSPGTYHIDGENVYAIVMEYVPRNLEQTKWESHRRYIDLHYVIRGKEKIGVASVSGATVTEAYDSAKDMAHYEASGEYYIAEPGVFFLFFPREAHRPGIKADGDSQVKKLVIKIREAE